MVDSGLEKGLREGLKVRHFRRQEITGPGKKSQALPKLSHTKIKEQLRSSVRQCAR